MERTIPKAYLELVPLAGHMIMLDQPKQLNAMMKKFIEKYLKHPPKIQAPPYSRNHAPTHPVLPSVAAPQAPVPPPTAQSTAAPQPPASPSLSTSSSSSTSSSTSRSKSPEDNK